MEAEDLTGFFEERAEARGLPNTWSCGLPFFEKGGDFWDRIQAEDFLFRELEIKFLFDSENDLHVPQRIPRGIAAASQSGVDGMFQDGAADFH